MSCFLICEMALMLSTAMWEKPMDTDTTIPNSCVDVGGGAEGGEVQASAGVGCRVVYACSIEGVGGVSRFDMVLLLPNVSARSSHLYFTGSGVCVVGVGCMGSHFIG